MQEKKYFKLVWLAAYVVFGGVSCWATELSLSLLLPSFPPIVCWIITIGFFLIASLGTKMVSDSINQNIYLEHRGAYLVGGVLLVLAFWLVCSMPTNTHTFFYRSLIGEKVSTDVLVTRGYLSQIKNNTQNENAAAQKVAELKSKAATLLGELEAEIKNEANPGFGSKSKEIFRKFAVLLDVDKIEPLSSRGTSAADRNKLCDAYRAKIYILVENKARNIVASILSPNKDNLLEVRNSDSHLEQITRQIANKTIDLENSKHMEGVCEELAKAYSVVGKNKDFVTFSSQADERDYTAKAPLAKAKALLSVYDVWKDFLHGNYDGRSFGFYILLSILVDVGAMVFFWLFIKK